MRVRQSLAVSTLLVALVAAAAYPGIPRIQAILTGPPAGTPASGAPARSEERVPAPAALTARFVTINLDHGGIFSGLTEDDEMLAARLRLVTHALRGIGADVVGLQEASIGSRRGHVAARLAAALGHHYVHAPAATRPFGSESIRRVVASSAVLDFTEGPAILSRFPIVDSAAYELPRCGRPFDVRVLVFAELLTPVGRLPVFSAHISGDPCQGRAVAERVRSHRGPLPAVVMGDFNAVESSPAIRTLVEEAGFQDAFRLANPTAAGFTEGQQLTAAHPTAARRIDYVFVAPGRVVPGEIRSSRVVLNQPQRVGGRVLWPSDHYGVLVDLAIDSPATVLPGRRPASRSSASRPGPEG